MLVNNLKLAGFKKTYTFVFLTSRFRTKIENMRSDKFDQSLTIKGLDYIDVPGLSAKDYKLTFHAHKECQPQIKASVAIQLLL